MAWQQSMTELLLTLGLVAVLPGPTNALLAVGGATGGWRAGLVLVATSVGAYVVSVGMLSVALSPAIESVAWLRHGVRGLVALWLLRSAVRLWRGATAPDTARVGWREVAVVTLLNPKAFFFALHLLPKSGLALELRLALVAATVTVTGSAWAGLGAAASQVSNRRWVWRGGALLLAPWPCGLA